VTGTYDRSFDPEGKPEKTMVYLTCNFPGCGATHQHSCESGAPRQWIQYFAQGHLHRDPLDHGAFKAMVKK
jgi:hypothetical protein